MIEHHNLTNFVFNFNDYFKLSSNSKVLLFSNICFDSSIEEIFPTLTRGSTLFIISEEIRKNVDELFDYFEKNEIEISTLPPSILEPEAKKSSNFL